MQSLALSPNFAVNNALFVIKNSNQVWESTDRGKTLKALAAPSPLTSLPLIAIYSQFRGGQYSIVGRRAMASLNRTIVGATGRKRTTTTSDLDALAFSPDFATDHTAFAGTLGSGVLRSTNNGQSWATSNARVPDLNVSSITLSAAYWADELWKQLQGTAGVFRQCNTAGTNWSLFATGTGTERSGGHTLPGSSHGGQAGATCIWQCTMACGQPRQAQRHGSMSIRYPPGLCVSSIFRLTMRTTRLCSLTHTAAGIQGGRSGCDAFAGRQSNRGSQMLLPLC